MLATKEHIATNEPEKEYSQFVSLEHRKKFAQFFTPFPIAQFMAKWITGNKKLETVLDPAFGLGVFARAIRQKNKMCSIKGFDIDENILRQARHPYAAHDGQVRRISARPANRGASGRCG